MKKAVVNILQGSVVTQTTLGGLTTYSRVANFLQCICAKNYDNWLAVDNVIAKIIRLTFLAHPVQVFARNSTVVSRRWARVHGWFRGLRSVPSLSLNVRRTRLSTVGDQALPVADARTWNSLPQHVTSAPSMSVFRGRLKAFLFRRSFPWLLLQLVLPAQWQLSFLDT